MRSKERLLALKAWAEQNLCEGRMMKAPGENFDISDVRYQQPRVYLGWNPSRPDETGVMRVDPISVTPGILIMPAPSYGKYVEEKRLDRFNKVHRPQELGQELAVNILFSVYEPGIRYPGFAESADQGRLDLSLLGEGTEEGLFTLMDWMDDCLQGLLAEMKIPNSDLALKEADLGYSLYTDQNYVVDKRPIFYGFVNAKFGCYADDGGNSSIEELLK